MIYDDVLSPDVILCLYDILWFVILEYIGILGPKGCFSSSACRALLFERAKIPAMQGPCDSSLCWASGWLNAQCQMLGLAPVAQSRRATNHKASYGNMSGNKINRCTDCSCRSVFLLDSTRSPRLSRFHLGSSREGHGATGLWGSPHSWQLAKMWRTLHFGRCPGAGLGGASVINIAMRNLLLRTAANIVTHSVSHDDIGVTRTVRAKGSTSAKWGGTIYPWHPPERAADHWSFWSAVRCFKSLLIYHPSEILVSYWMGDNLTHFNHL